MRGGRSLRISNFGSKNNYDSLSREHVRQLKTLVKCMRIMHKDMENSERTEAGNRDL
jgi:hypothetical protein